MSIKNQAPQQTANPQVLYPMQEQEDEINLADLARAIWKTRKIWFVTMVIVSLLFWGIWAAKYLLNPAPLSYSLPITFTFPGIEQGNYPNGSPFLRSDLITPSIIKTVYDRNKLIQYKLTLDDFYPMIRTTPYALDQSLVQQKYQLLLANKKITAQEIDDIRKRQKEEMEQSALRGARITFTPEGVQIPDNIIANILADIPSTWARKAINERGVLKLDLELIGESIFQQEILDRLDYMISFDYLNEKIELIEKNIIILKQQPNGLTARDPESNLTLPELQLRLNDVKNYQLRLLLSPTHELGLSKNKNITLHHYHNKLIRLQQEQNELLEKAKLTRRTYQNYMGQQQNQTAAKSVRQDIPALPNNVTTQLGGTFLDRVMELSDKASDITYRQDLSRQQQEYEEKSIEISSVIQETKRNIKSLSEDLKPGKEQEVRSYFYEEIKNGIPSLLTQLRSIAHIVEKMQQKIGVLNQGGNDSLYLLVSEKVGVSGGRLDLAKRQVLIYFVLMMVATIVVILVVLFRNSMLKEKKIPIE